MHGKYLLWAKLINQAFVAALPLQRRGKSCNSSKHLSSAADLFLCSWPTPWWEEQGWFCLTWSQGLCFTPVLKYSDSYLSVSLTYSLRCSREGELKHSNSAVSWGLLTLKEPTKGVGSCLDHTSQSFSSLLHLEKTKLTMLPTKTIPSNPSKGI